jgi:predicted NAD/FAD-dependent oxidoreductase
LNRYLIPAESNMSQSGGQQQAANDSRRAGSSVAVIGAGISGLCAARILQDQGFEITVFEKSRGLGGRMSTRRVEDDHSFDHGAQFFTATNPRFQDHVTSWIEQGIVARWPDTSIGESQPIVVLRNGELLPQTDEVERFVGVPTMNSICKHLANDLQVTRTTRITVIEKVDTRVRLTDDQGQVHGEFDHAIVAIPPHQAADLLVHFPVVAEPISNINMSPNWTVMAAFEEPITQDWSGAFIHSSFLTWAARNNTKPGRPQAREHVVIHADPNWTAENWDGEPEVVANEILDEFWRATGIETRKPIDIQTHRWQFAVVVGEAESSCFSDTSSGVHACGDWAAGGRVEGAFLSGLAAAERVLGVPAVPT